MTQAAQAALRRGERFMKSAKTPDFKWLGCDLGFDKCFGSVTVIEQYTKNVRFCIVCNYVNRIAPAIQSRCTRFRFGPLDLPEIDRRVSHVVDAEGFVICSCFQAPGVGI